MSTPTTLTSIELLYFPICGRGEPIRYILEDAGVPYEESNDVERFRRGKEDCEEFSFGQLPRVTVRSFVLCPLHFVVRAVEQPVSLRASAQQRTSLRTKDVN